MGRIRVLPDSVINRIAAGEVVERPSSVLKELVENSLDAGASSIAIRVEEGGRRLVEVRDDGEGMDSYDAVAALERHATSKLTPASVLEAITTLGFRGEALPSIAAVARFTLTTSPDGLSGTRVVVDGGRIISSGPAAHPRGTTISVADLFYNTPARQRFLRAAGTEMSHLVEAAIGLALSRPDVRFRLDHAARRILDLPPATELLARLAQIEGAATARAAVRVGAERGGVSVAGFILRGDESGASRGTRRFLVKGRVVRDRILSSAAGRTLDQMLPLGSAASCLLVIDLPPESVDVNVHPAKAEVRFAEPGKIHDLVRDALRQAIGGTLPLRSAAPAESALGSAGGLSDDAELVDGFKQRIAEAASSYLTHHEEPGVRPGARAAATPRPFGGVGDGEALIPKGAPAVVGHYRSGYILAQDEEGLILVDQHAAHERILFEELTDSVEGEAAPTQALLFPRTVTLPPGQRASMDLIPAELGRLGFDVEPFGESTIVVRGVPAPLADIDPERLLLDLLGSVEEERRGSTGLEERRRRMLSTAACHAAVKVPAQLTPEKIGWILERLLLCRSPLLCPHGRPTMLRWTHRAIERRFGRP